MHMYIHVLACTSTLIYKCSINWNCVLIISSPEVLKDDIKIKNSVTAPVPCICIVYTCTLCACVPTCCDAQTYISSIILADTSRRPKADEDQYSFHFVTESHMKEEIHKHKFIEFGKHQSHYYGIKVESVLDVVNSGKMCILDVHPQVRWAVFRVGRISRANS